MLPPRRPLKSASVELSTRRFIDTSYVCLNCEQLPLAKGKANKKQAESAFYRLLAEGGPARPLASAGTLAIVVTHFVRVTRNYWPGLFHCNAVPDLPRTNNAKNYDVNSYLDG
jgi:hypothetical protein